MRGAGNKKYSLLVESYDDFPTKTKQYAEGFTQSKILCLDLFHRLCGALRITTRINIRRTLFILKEIHVAAANNSRYEMKMKVPVEQQSM